MFTSWLLVVLIMVFLLARDVRRGEEQLKATIEDCDASEELTNWRIANPYLCISDDPWARELVIQRIVAWKYFLKTHPFVRDDGLTEFLYSLLDDHKPSSGERRR